MSPGARALQCLRSARSSLSVVLAVVLAWSGVARASDHYVIDPLHSTPVFEFMHLGVTTQSGRFDRVRGSLDIDLARRAGSVNYEVDTASLNMGVGTETQDSAGYALFDVAHFPLIRFESAHLSFDPDGKVTSAVGQLSLLGVSKSVTLSIEHFSCGLNAVSGRRTCAGDVSTLLRRSDFGMVKYLPYISDEIHIRIPVEAYQDLQAKP